MNSTWGINLLTRIYILFFSLLSALILTHSGPVWSQTDESEKEVEDLYDKTEEPKPVKKPEASREKAEPAAQTLSDLAGLSEFEDVAVIQKRFLPKTGRFEFSLSGITNTNNPFFNNIGAGLRLGYYFHEKHGAEVQFNWLATSARQVTDDLEGDPNNISTTSLVTSKGYIGAAYKWNPIYGKITWLNKKIIPFDLNFTLGGGLTRTNADRNEPTLHFGTSQIFAWSKSMAFRWDLTWNMFKAESKDATGATDTVAQNDLFIGLGMSFYFPEADYR